MEDKKNEHFEAVNHDCKIALVHFMSWLLIFLLHTPLVYNLGQYILMKMFIPLIRCIIALPSEKCLVEICLIHIHTYMCCKYLHIEFVDWEVKQMKASGDCTPFFLVVSYDLRRDGCSPTIKPAQCSFHLLLFINHFQVSFFRLLLVPTYSFISNLTTAAQGDEG